MISADLLQRYGLDDGAGSEDDLEARSREPTPTHREIVPGNAWFGQAALIKAYAGWEPERPLRVALPHGVEYEGPMMRRRESVPVIIHFASGLDTEYRSQLRARRVWRMRAPFLLVPELVGGQLDADRSGTIFFPAHSYAAPSELGGKGGGSVAKFDASALSDRLLALPAEMQPVTVCLFYVDYLLGKAAPFQKRGLRVVSAGHRLDTRFLVRLHRICSAHRYAGGTSGGSHVFYSVAAGCRYFQIDSHAEYDGMPASQLQRFVQASELIAAQLEGKTQAEQLAVVAPYLGMDMTQSPSELQALLRRAELLDRFGFARVPDGDRMRLDVAGPWAAARAAYRMVRRAFAR